jgi:hypothetical protein
MAANKNIKHHYIAISAKLIHCSAEMVKTIESSERKNRIDPFVETVVRTRIAELSKTISNYFPKQLMLSTRMAIGVWPPPDAVAQMIREAAGAARSCKELSELANTLGYFPVVSTDIELSVRWCLTLVPTI